jgi:hypothetical protein
MALVTRKRKTPLSEIEKLWVSLKYLDLENLVNLNEVALEEFCKKLGLADVKATQFQTNMFLASRIARYCETHEQFQLVMTGTEDLPPIELTKNEESLVEKGCQELFRFVQRIQNVNATLTAC